MLARLKHNWGQKLFAFFSALFLWIYVHSQENPIITQVIRKEIEIKGLAPGLIITSHLPTLNITIRGAKKRIEQISPNSIRASISLEGKDVGIHSVSVRVSTPRGLNVSYKPHRIKVVIDKIVSQQMAVQPIITSPPPEGFTLKAIYLNPQNVSVYYPLSKRSEVASANVLVDLGRGEGDYTLPVLIMDRGNKPMQNVRVIPPLVKVSINFYVSKAVKVVPVVPDFAGSLPNNLILTKVEVYPSVVAISGPNTVLAGLDSIKTEKIDLSNIESSCSLEVKLVKPDRVSILDRKTVSVKLTIGSGSSG
ncbi:MAG: CdaR family protein [bacterium]